MTVKSMASFKEAKVKKDAASEKFRKRLHYRYLGGRVHIAYDYHHCDRCIFSIAPGDQYRRDAYANYFRIKVEKHHWPECYGPTEEEDREIREQIEREREAEREAERRAA